MGLAEVLLIACNAAVSGCVTSVHNCHTEYTAAAPCCLKQLREQQQPMAMLAQPDPSTHDVGIQVDDVSEFDDWTPARVATEVMQHSIGASKSTMSP